MFVKKTIRSIESRGLKETLLVILNEIIFSIRYNAKFNETIKLDSLSIDSPNKINGVLYHGSSYYYAKLAFRNLPVDYKDSALIDFGSGKGNVLLMAHSLGFKKILGIEFAEELVRFSERRIKRLKKVNTSSEIKIIHSDAASYAIPNDIDVFFFYNPFNRNVFEKVLENIEDSLNIKKRIIYIIYLNAVIEKELFLKFNYSLIFEHQSNEKSEVLIFSK